MLTAEESVPSTAQGRRVCQGKTTVPQLPARSAWQAVLPPPQPTGHLSCFPLTRALSRARTSWAFVPRPR